MRHFLIFLLSFLAACGTHESAQQPRDSLRNVIAKIGVDPNASSLVIVRLRDGQRWDTNPARADIPYTPASTSKIPHTLIALDTGTYTPDSTFMWDGVKRSFEFWNRDQTLASAYKVSAVWVYQNITNNLGPTVMRNYLRAFEYGNYQIGGADKLTNYWLGGPLEISVNEQLVFLRKLIQQELPLKASTYAVIPTIMREADGQDWQLFAKTGWYSDGENRNIGWYVGWVESTAAETATAEHYLFAYNMEMRSDADAPLRRQVVRAALEHIKALPPSSLPR